MVRFVQVHGGTRLATMPPVLGSNYPTYVVTSTPHVGTLSTPSLLDRERVAAHRPTSTGRGSHTRAGRLHYGSKRLSCRGGREREEPARPGARPPLWLIWNPWTGGKVVLWGRRADKPSRSRLTREVRSGQARSARQGRWRSPCQHGSYGIP